MQEGSNSRMPKLLEHAFKHSKFTGPIWTFMYGTETYHSCWTGYET